MRGIATIILSASALIAQPAKLHYPVAKTVDHTDDYGGQKVSDPYRWLENTDSKETTEWVESENKITFAYLASLPGREKIKQRLTELFNYDRYSGAFQRGGRYFVFHNDGLQNQNVLFTMDSSKAKERVLLDPNTLRKDGTAALSGWSVSRDGKLLGYAIAQAGSDWSEWHVRDIATGKDLPDLIQWTKFTHIEWTLNNKAFYYMRFPEPASGDLLKAANYNAKVYLHRLGEPQSSDSLSYERPDHPDWRFYPQLSEDGRYLGITIEAGDAARNLFFYRDLKTSETRTVELISQFAATYDWLGNEGSWFYFRTTDGAPKGHIIKIDVNHPDAGDRKEIVSEKKDSLEGTQLVDGKLILSYLTDAHSQATLCALDGKLLQDIALPGIGTVNWSPAGQKDKEAFYSFANFISPAEIYRYDLQTQSSSEFRASKLSFDPAVFETKQVFYNSKDGTRVPMFLTYKKGIQLNSRNPTLLYAYGGFNIAITPSFNPAMIDWMEMGGIYAVANIRGGSEYGEAWHQAGTKLHKQNVFDDFIAAAEWLIANKYTSTPKLAIYGGSNGGLLVGAVLNQRPELFGAAMPAVGVMDMLRFNQFTVGAGWMGDYGSPQNPEEFKALRAYSPLHNIRKGAEYPPTLITTSDHDDRVFPGHSFKYAAALQAAQEGPAPILIRVETRAGHGAGKPISKIIDEYADRWAFLAKALNISAAE